MLSSISFRCCFGRCFVDTLPALCELDFYSVRIRVVREDESRGCVRRRGLATAIQAAAAGVGCRALAAGSVRCDGWLEVSQRHGQDLQEGFHVSFCSVFFSLTGHYDSPWLFCRGLYRYLQVLFRVRYLGKMNRTVPRIFARLVKQNPDKVAIIFEDKKWTYKQVSDRIASID